MTNWKLLLFTAALLGGVLTLRAGEFADDLTWDSKPEQRAKHAAMEGKPMPNLYLSQWINGVVKPADMKGKVVVLDFYATWCGPCMAAIPHNNEMFKSYQDKGLVVIGVCTSSNGQEKFAENAKQHEIKYPAARDTSLASRKRGR